MKKLTILLALNCVFAMTVMCSSDVKEEVPNDTAPQTEAVNDNSTNEPATEEAVEDTMDGEQLAVNTPPAPAPDLPPSGSTDPVIGRVVDIVAMGLGSDGLVDKAGAEAAVAKGHPLGLMVEVGGKKMVFYIVHNNGQMATEELVRRSIAKVAVIGKRTNNNGINVIVAQKIESIR